MISFRMDKPEKNSYFESRPGKRTKQYPMQQNPSQLGARNRSAGATQYLPKPGIRDKQIPFQTVTEMASKAKVRLESLEATQVSAGATASARWAPTGWAPLARAGKL